MKKILLGAVMSASVVISGFAATPAMAQRHHQDRGDYYYDDGYRGDYRGREYRDYRGDRRDYRYARNYRDRRCKGTSGAIIGGVIGALLGGEIGSSRYRGRSTTGTIVGAGAGALVGKEISQSNCRRR